MRRASTLALASLFLAACGRSQLGPADSDPPPDGDAPPVRCEDDADCDDRDPCNGLERCVDDACVPGVPVRCDDGVECTADTCDSDSGECVSLPDHSRCGRGELCDPVAGCVRRVCTSSEDCDDGAFCNGAEYCEGGFCAPGAPPECDDGIGCTADRCDEAAGRCASTPDDARCDDGRYCNGLETCDPAVGCRPGAPVRCDDGDPCTLDSCDDATGSCVHAPRDADRDGFADCACARPPCDCDDRDPTVNPGMTEQCRDGRDNDCNGLVDCDDRAACSSDPRCATTECTSDAECSDGVFCNGVERCGEGLCSPGTPPGCGDRVRCTVDFCDPLLDACVNRPDHGLCRPGELCDPVAGCVRRPCASDADCSDGLFCTGVEVCAADGTCAAGPEPCGEAGPCETVLCDEAARSCAVTVRDEDRDGFPPLECGGGDCDDRDPRVNPGAAEVCWDGRDNDCDGRVDCGDSDCAWYPPCSAPTTEIDCANGVDDDLDGLVDCFDPDCDGSPLCAFPDTCTDAVDVTGLSVVTGSTAALADDYRPDTTAAGCAGGRGPDAVYYIVLAAPAYVRLDTFGSGYDTVLYVRERHCTSGVQVGCNDDAMGLDSEVELYADAGFYFIFVDGYGSSSAGDFVLHIEVLPFGAEDCANGLDDDGDGLADCLDPDCAGDPRCAPGPEMGVAACTDGRDNDGDGLVDCDDAESCAVVSFIGECCNGVDDNRNGVVDEFACSCDAAHPCDTGVCYGGDIGACGPPCTSLGGDRFCRWVFPGTTCSAATGACE